MKLHVLVLVFGLFGSAVPAQAQWGKILGKLTRKDSLSESRIGEGLKEALRVGTGNAVRQTGRPDGYFRHEIIKILLPEELQKVERGLRTVGKEEVVDDFVLSMNRAAERAAPAAKRIFWDAILAMSFADARQLLGGSDTAATDYFREKTGGQLTEAFRPVVREALDEVGATRKYKELAGYSKSIPFVRLQPVDLDEYVVAKALKGLFHVLGEEEKKIRTDPAARVTDLLKEVFARRSERARAD